MHHEPPSTASTLRRFVAIATIALTAVGAITTTASVPAGAATTAPPTYRVELASFTCIVETDEVGSDEIYATYDSPYAKGDVRSGRTDVADDVDYYETHHWSTASRVIWGTPTTGHAVGAKGLNSVITLWEHDDSKANSVAAVVHRALGYADDVLGSVPIVGWIVKALTWVSGAVAGIVGKNHDDFIGKQVVHYDRASLEALLTHRGQSFTDYLVFTGDGGKYLVPIKVTRVS